MRAYAINADLEAGPVDVIDCAQSILAYEHNPESVSFVGYPGTPKTRTYRKVVLNRHWLQLGDGVRAVFVHPSIDMSNDAVRYRVALMVMRCISKGGT